MNRKRFFGLVLFALATVALVAYRAYFFGLPTYLNVAFVVLLVYIILSFLGETFIRVPLAEKYRLIESDFEPKVTIVIPVLNEADDILTTVNSALSSNYPKEKLEVIAVDDGSTDGTTEILDSIRAENLRVIHFPKNKGKREALYAAFKLATGEIVVTIDSDTVIDPNCVMNIVSPFSNPEIGGVCGHVDVINENKNILTRMQAALYFVAFYITRKSESLYNTVVCISGCAAAYRLSAINGLIDEWKNQKFLGAKCRDSEDRGLTTMLLRSGFSTVYTSKAITSTYVPEKFTKYVKQQIRWRRGFLREAILGSKFMYQRRMGASIFFYANNFAIILSPFVTIIWVFVLPVFFGWGLIGIYLVGAALTALGISIYCKSGRANYSITSMLLWSVFNLITNPLISLYAYLTVRRGTWLTR